MAEIITQSYRYKAVLVVKEWKKGGESLRS